MKKLPLDKRVVLFLLFALPVMFVAFISYVLNTQSIYPGSKASEPNMPAVSSSSSLPSLQMEYCLSPQLIASTGMIEVYPDPEVSLPDNSDLKIYAVGPTSIQYVSLVKTPPPSYSSSLTAISSSMLEKGSLVRFAAILTDSNTLTLSQSDFEEGLRLFVRECQAIVLD